MQELINISFLVDIQDCLAPRYAHLEFSGATKTSVVAAER